MPQSVHRNPSYQDILALPEHLVGEILAGELYAHPRPAPKHARAYSALTGSLWNLFDEGSRGPGGWWILDEPELPETAWFEFAPDWACEILSPATERTDRAVKIPIYARVGVTHLWLVDPDARTLEVYRLQDDGHWLLLTTLQEDEAAQQPPFEAVGFPLGRLWG